MPNDCCTSCCIDGADCETVKSIQRHSLSRQIFASSLASVISTLSLNPITVVKVRLQNLPASISSSSINAADLSIKLSPLRNVIRNVITNHGIAGFWAGTRTGIVMSVPNTVLYMSVYEHLKEKLAEEPRMEPVRAISPAIAGALARMVSVTIISPLEMVRTIQTGGASDSVGTIMRSIVAKDGIKGLYRGWAPSVLRDCPFSAIYWLGFETLRPIYSKLLITQPTLSLTTANGSVSAQDTKDTNHARDGFPAFITFLSGATAGMVAAVCTHPFDVLKTRQQVNAWAITSSGAAVVAPASTIASGSASASGSTSVSGSSTSTGTARPVTYTLRGIYQSEGILALYRGLSMRLATVIPASAIMVTIYETIKRLDI